MQIAAVIVTDLIGHDASWDDFHLDIPDMAKPVADFATRGIKKIVAVMGAETNGAFPAIIEAAAKEAKDIKVLPTLYAYVGPVSDHAAFSQAGHPFLFLSCGQGKYYHHPKDDMEWINFEKLTRITRFIGDLIERIDLTPTDADTSPVNPFDMEIRMLKDILGPILPLGLKYFGFNMPDKRQELDVMIDTALHGNPHKAT